MFGEVTRGPRVHTWVSIFLEVGWVLSVALTAIFAQRSWADTFAILDTSRLLLSDTGHAAAGSRGIALILGRHFASNPSPPHV